MRRPSALAVVLLVILGLLLPVDALAVIELPSGFTDQLVVGGVSNPTAIDWLPNGELLIATRGGVVYRFTGSGSAQQALNLGAAFCPGGETGLLGLAVDPQFATDGFIYLYYTRNRGNCNSAAGRTNRVARFTMNDQDALTGEQVLIDNIPAVGGNHNGGDLQFGNDRLLYISVGDSGQDFHTGKGQDANGNARRLDVLNGKILRIEKYGAIPADNPFAGAGTSRCAGAEVVRRQGAGVSAQKAKKGKKGKRGGNRGKGKKGKKKKKLPPLVLGPTCQEIFATGLRNPYRIAFDQNDPSLEDQRFFINDVGGDGFEEINEGAIGADYGWNVREGPCAINNFNSCTPTGPFKEPIYSFGHGHSAAPTSSCNVVTGGAFVPAGRGWPAEYLFADLGCGTIFSMNRNGSVVTEFGTGVAATHLAFGPDNALYYTDFSSGSVHKITAP